VSQSGALTSSILDWARQNAVGFSTVVSLGPHTGGGHCRGAGLPGQRPPHHSIVVYMEGISNARRFMSALRAAANAKPVVVLKAGRKPAGNAAAQTHSGAIVGSDDVFDAALRRAGAVRVRSFVELFSAAKCLASRYRPVGRAWPSSPTAAAPACWRPTGSTRSACNWAPVAESAPTGCPSCRPRPRWPT
jgi:acetyltransferase